MTLRDYVKIFRQRWWAVVACALVAGVVTFFVTPATASDEPPVSSYTATATLLVGSVGGTPMGRIALFVTTGDVPVLAAQQLGYTGDPVVLATEMTVTMDQAAQALTISATNEDGQVAADRANAFAQASVDYFNELGSGTTLSILQSATPVPNMPTGGAVVPPNRALRTGLGTLVGLLLGLGLAIVLDHLDARLRTRDEIGEATGLPIVAEIPKLSRSERQTGGIIVSQSPLSVYSDGYRAARSAVLHSSSKPMESKTSRPGTGGTFGHWEPEDSYEVAPALPAGPGGSVIMITSALPGEGKTTSAANIAASFAETGKRVLVMDADLRSPNLHELFDVPQGAGVSDYLTRPESVSLAALVRPTTVEGVGIVTAGNQLENPATLTSRMEPLIQAARKIADVVIVDSSPILGASDGFDIIPLVDSVLLVVRSGRLTAVAAQRVGELLKRFQVPVAGVVLVAVPARGSDGYGYGYGYGYGANKKAGRKRSSKTVAASANEPAAAVSAAPGATEAGHSGQPRQHARRARRAVSRDQDA